jgi:hypothetical protein
MMQSAFRYRALLGMIIALPALLLLAAGCGDDDNGGGNATKTAAASHGSTSEATKTEAAGDNSGGNSGGGASNELKNLSKDWSKATAKLAYQFQSTSQGTTTSTNMTFYSKPPDSRIDYEIAGAGKAIFINSGGKSYTCSESGGQGTCFESPGGSNSSSLPFFGDLADPDSIDSAVAGILGSQIASSDENVAGQDAKCFTASGSFVAESGESKWCFTNDGLLLSASFSGGGASFSMTATNVDHSVSEDDLKPPYDVTSIPGG